MQLLPESEHNDQLPEEVRGAAVDKAGRCCPGTIDILYRPPFLPLRAYPPTLQKDVSSHVFPVTTFNRRNCKAQVTLNLRTCRFRDFPKSEIFGGGIFNRKSQPGTVLGKRQIKHKRAANENFNFYRQLFFRILILKN